MSGGGVQADLQPAALPVCCVHSEGDLVLVLVRWDRGYAHPDFMIVGGDGLRSMGLELHERMKKKQKTNERIDGLMDE